MRERLAAVTADGGLCSRMTVSGWVSACAWEPADASTSIKSIGHQVHHQTPGHADASVVCTMQGGMHNVTALYFTLFRAFKMKSDDSLVK